MGLRDRLPLWMPGGKSKRGVAVRMRSNIGDLQAARITGGEGADQQGWAQTAYGTYFAQSVPVYTAVKARMDAISEAPLRLYQRRGGGAQPVPETHPLQKLFSKVNPWWTHADLLSSLEMHLNLWGSAYWLVEKSGNQPIAIWPLRPDRMQVVPDPTEKPGNQYIRGYIYQGENGKRISYLPDEVVWFRYLNPMAEYAGFSPVAVGRLSFDMGREALAFNRAFFSNGAVPQDILFQSNEPVSDEEAEAFYQRLERRHGGGASNMHRPFIWDLSQGPKPERIGLTHREMQFIEALRWTVADAARVFKVPPELMGEGEVTFSNRREARVFFYTSTIQREWMFIASEINELLMPILGADDDLFVQFDTSKVAPLQEALSSRREQMLGQVAAGVLTQNEMRAELGMEPLPWGDVWWAPANLLPVETPVVPAAPPAAVAGGVGAVEGRSVALQRFADVWVKLLDSRERRFAEMQGVLFGHQEKSVLAALRRQDEIAEGIDRAGIPGGQAKRLPPAESLFDPVEWAKLFDRNGRPLIVAALTQAAQDAVEAFTLPPFDADTPRVGQWIDKRVDFWSARVNEETARLLKKAVGDAALAGESIPELQARVHKLFGFSEEFRTERIARTEMLSASNTGSVEAYRQSGEVEKKEWLSIIDDRTRESHVAANGQVVGLDAPFSVGGASMDRPGDGPAAEVVNCRCTTVPVLRRQIEATEMWEGVAAVLRNGRSA